MLHALGSISPVLCAMVCGLATAILGAMMSFLKRPESPRMRNWTFFISLLFIVGVFVFGIVDKYRDSISKQVQKDSIDDLGLKEKALAASVNDAQVALNRAFDKIKSIEEKSRQLSEKLDAAAAQIANSLDKTGRQISDQIKSNSFVIKQEMKRSAAFNQKKLDEFSAASSMQADDIQREVRSSSNSIRSLQTNIGNQYNYGINDGAIGGSRYQFQNYGPHTFVPLGRSGIMMGVQ